MNKRMFSKEVYEFLASERKLLKAKGLNLRQSTEIINPCLHGATVSESQIYSANYHRIPEVKDRMKKFHQRPDQKKNREEYYQRTGVKKRKREYYLSVIKPKRMAEYYEEVKMISGIIAKDSLTETDLLYIKPYLKVISYLSKPGNRKKFKSIAKEISMKSPRSVMKKMLKLKLVTTEDKRYGLTEPSRHINDLCKWFMQDDINPSLVKPESDKYLKSLFAFAKAEAPENLLTIQPL